MQEGNPDQHWAASWGSLDVAANALRRYPDDKRVQMQCLGAVGSNILFNRPLGLYAGQNGLLELALHALTHWPDDPDMCKWGMAGCFFDAVPENRAIYMNLGGVEQQHAAFKRHYWHPNVVGPAYAYSSVCYDKEVSRRCVEVGALEDGIQAMRDHPHTSRVREEFLQMTKALSVNWKEYSHRLVEVGAFEQYAKAINESLSDNHVVALSCENFGIQIGGGQWSSVQGPAPDWEFNATIQAVATEVGGLQAVWSAIKNEHNMLYNRGLKEHGYDVKPFCFQALALMAYENPGQQDILTREDAPAKIVGLMNANSWDVSAVVHGCKVLRILAFGSPESRAAVEKSVSLGVPQPCSWNLPFKPGGD
jgi:hypothetical protein